MNVYLIVYPVPSNLNQIIKKPAYVIAVDQGLFDAYKQGVKVDLAIGDFDSLIDKSLLEGIKTIKLNPKKDVTDTESAVRHAKTFYPEHIYILGGLGGLRFEHSYANLLLLFEYENLSIISEHTKIVKYGVGRYEVTYPAFINIFTPEGAIISLKGFKYDLNRYELNRSDRLGISNELIGQKGEIEVIDGSIVVMYSKKD